jgi:hypothetical protein
LRRTEEAKEFGFESLVVSESNVSDHWCVTASPFCPVDRRPAGDRLAKRTHFFSTIQKTVLWLEKFARRWNYNMSSQVVYEYSNGAPLVTDALVVAIRRRAASPTCWGMLLGRARWTRPVGRDDAQHSLTLWAFVVRPAGRHLFESLAAVGKNSGYSR